MSDDLFAQQRANDAAHAANQAQRLAIEAAHQSAMAAIDAQKGRAAMEQAAEESRAMQAHLAREQAATNEVLERSALVQEAAAAIPLLRDTLARALARRPAIRALAQAWLKNGADSPQQEALLAQVLDGGAPDAATWLAYALGYSRARDAGDLDKAEGWRRAALHAAPLAASAWIFLDALKRGDAPDAGHFAALADALRGCRQLNATLYLIVARAGEGHFGAACQAANQALLRDWVHRQQQDPRALLDRMFGPAAPPAELAALEQVDHQARKYYQQRVITAWRGLRGIEAALDKPAQAFAMEDPRTLALSGMAVFAALPDEDELRTVSRLAFYQAALDSRGDPDATLRAERQERRRHAGDWYALDEVVASLADYGMRQQVLDALRPAIVERAAARADPDIGSAPPLSDYQATYASWQDYHLRQLEARRRDELRASGQFAGLQWRAQRAATAGRYKAMLRAAMVWGVPAAMLGAFVMFNPLNPLAWIRRWLEFYGFQYPLLDDLLFFGGVAAWLAGRKAKRQPIAVLPPLEASPAQAAEWTRVDAAHSAVLEMQAELPRIHGRIRARLQG